MFSIYNLGFFDVPYLPIMNHKSLIIDGHLDLAMNAIDWNRDLRKSVEEIRRLEHGKTDLRGRANSTISFDEMRRGKMGLCLSTLIARYAKPDHPLGGWQSPEQAWAQTCAQLAWYREMEREGQMRQITSAEGLEQHLQQWMSGSTDAIGYILTLEGADSIISWDHLQQRVDEGLIAIGPAHYGPGTYAFGTDSEGSIGAKGKALLREMEKRNLVLDATHLCDTSFWEAMECFSGHVWASHSNCRKIVDHNRQFADEQLKTLLERDAVIGLPLDAWMMIPGWIKFQSHPSNTDIRLEHMVNHIDHICELAGDTNHVGLGTDLDGGFGLEQTPSDVHTIADMQKLPDILASRGYSDDDIEKIMWGNWLRKIKEVLN